MNCLRFTLSGEFACFRRPDVNALVYYTYNNIHKVALLGLLGAVLGLPGYRNKALFGDAKDAFPEFYQQLSPLLVSIVPHGKNGYFSKRIQYFNNSVGYASQEAGGNLQVREQWLENPRWTILLMQGAVQDSLWQTLCDDLINSRSVYLPYLGRNDFPAEISQAEMIDISPTNPHRIDSLFRFDGDLKQLGRGRFLFVETAPVALVPIHQFYDFARLVYTDAEIPQDLLPKDLYSDGVRSFAFL